MEDEKLKRDGIFTGFEHSSNSFENMSSAQEKVIAHHSAGFVKIGIFIALAILVLGGGLLALKVRSDQQTNKIAVQPSDNYAVQDIPLDDLVNSGSVGLSTLQSLSVNGQLRANNSLVLAPSERPKQGTMGQLYYDKDGNALAYYDGTKFVDLAGTDQVEDLQQQLIAVRDSIPQAQEIPQDIATLGGNNTFTGINSFTGSLSGVNLALSGAAALQGTLNVSGSTTLSSATAANLTVSGAVNLGPTTASSLVLSSPLAVGSGGTGASSFTTNGVLIGQGSSPLGTVSAGGPGLCLVSTAGAPAFQACPGGGGSVVDSLNGLSGPLTLANASGAGSTITIDDATTAAKGIASFNATNFSVSGGAVNTIQNIAVTSSPTFGGLTLNGNLSVGANSIVTSGATISSSELDVLDGGIAEGEVTGIITDVTAGSGLTGGAASGNATLNIASANGGITVNADNIALALQPAGDGLSSTTSSGSGLEILTSGVSLLQGCSDGQILKWNEVSDTWGCAADAGGSGVGDDTLINGLNADGANFIDTVASGSLAGVAWNLNTTPSPDEISITISNASAAQAGVVTTGAQTFSGDKTYNNAMTVTGLFAANGGVTIEAGDTFTFNGDAFTDLSGTGLVVAGGVLQAALGTSIESSEITDLTVTGADIANDTITDTQLAFNTGQHLTVTSAPTFTGVTLNGNLSIGTNSIVTDATTIGSTELDVLDGGIAEGEVTGVITDVTAGNGLAGGAASGNATLNIASANGGITVNADNIALTLQPAGDGISSTTSSGSGLEILSSGLTLLQGCSDGQILKWNETNDTWSCAADAGGSGVGDDTLVNGLNADGANFIDTTATGSLAGVAWSLNTTPNPDEISITVSNASATAAGVITTGVQSFAGDKTFNNAINVSGLFTANGGVTIEAGDTFTFNGDAFTDLTGTGLTIAGGILQAALGTSIESSEITDLTITGADIANDTITDTQLAFNTGQHLAVSSTPSFAGITLTGDLSLGTNNIVTGATTIGSTELDVLDGGIAESEVTGVITDVTAGNGLTGGGASGNATLNVISANGGITVSADNIALALQPTGDALSSTTSSGSGLEILATGLSLLQGCSDSQVLKWNETTDVWECATDGTGGNISGSGSTNRLAKFSGAQAIGDSSITDDGSTVTTTANLVIQGGNVTAGTSAQLGSFILHDGNGQTTTLQAGDSAANLTLTLPNAAGNQYQCLKYDTGGQLIWDDCEGGSSGSGGVTSLNSLTGDLTIQGNAQIAVSASSPNVSLSIQGDSIGDTQLAFNTGQHLTTTSAPTFAGLTLNGDLTIGTNNIVTGAATISSTELDVLDGGVDESEVTGAITDVTAGNGLTGGSASGNATVNIASANGGIVVNADSIALTLQPAGDGLSSTASSGSGLEILSTGFGLLQGCGDGQVLKWNETTDTWGCSDDAGGSGLGDDVSVNGSGATNANFINSVASGTSASVTWSLNTTPSPDEISIVIGNASATEAGAVTTGAQTFAGAKTFNAQILANGGIDLGTQTLQGTTAVIDFTNFDVLANGNTTVGGTLTVIGATALNDNVTVAAGKSLTLVGGNTASRPGSPTEGMVYYDTDTDNLLVYSNGKWQADGTSVTKTVAPSGAAQQIKDSADYVADGTADQVEINQALSAAAGGKVYLFEGTFTTTDSISIPNNTTLTGAGKGTLIQFGNLAGASKNMITNTTTGGNGTGITIRDLKLDGDKATNGTDTVTGIYLDGIGNTSTNLPGATVTNTTIQNFENNGIHLLNAANNTISSNTIQLNDDYGIFTNNVNHDVITDNIISSNTLNGIYLSASGREIVSTNVIASNGNYGIRIDAGSNNTISNNILRSNTGSSSTSSILITGGAGTEAHLITGNNITDTAGTGYAIDINDATVDNVYLSNNTYSGVGAASINDASGGDTVYAGQTNGSGNLMIQPAGSIQLMKDTTVSGNLTIGSNNIITGATTISSVELDVLDGGIAEGEVTGVITDVTAGSGLTGGAASGNATVNIASANGGIVVNADNIALTLQPAGDGLSSTTSSGSGLEILATGFSLLQGCADNQILKWNETTDVWACGDDAGGSGLGDDVYVNGTTATNANFINTVASGTSASVTWSLNTTPSPDEISIVIGNASATEAGAVTTGSQTFAGAKTFNAQIAANGGINLGAQTIQGTSAVIDFTNFDVLSNGSVTVGGSLTVNGTSTLNDNVSVAAGKSLTLTGSGTRPGSPTNGMLYYDTTTQQLLVYGNGKWQADKSGAVLVAASNSSQADKDAADYIADGTDDQVEINSALTAASTSGTRKTGLVYLFAGTYVTHQTNNSNATILIPNNVTLAGSGRGTLIELGNIDATDNLIENSDTSTGTGVTIRDLRLDGRKDLNTAGTQRGISLSAMGGGTGASARLGGQIDNVVVANFRSENILLTNSSHNTITNTTVLASSSDGLQIGTSSAYNVVTGSKFQGNTSNGLLANGGSGNNTITGNNAQGNSNGFHLANSSNNTISGNTSNGNTSYGYQTGASAISNTYTSNTAQGNTSGGFNVSGTGNVYSGNSSNGGTNGFNINANSNTVTGNTVQGATQGFQISADHNTISGNTINSSITYGIQLTSANNNSVSGNRIYDTGGSTANNGIYLVSADANNIADNAITDGTGTTNCSTTCHAINITNAGSDTNYLSGNVLGNGTINDTGTGTIFGGQANSSGNYLLQPSGSIELLKNTNVTGNIVATGTLQGTQLISTVSTGTAPLTVSSTTLVANLNSDSLDGQDGSFYRDASNINAGTLAVDRGGTGAGTFTQYGILFGNGTGAFGVTAAGTTGQCLLATTSAAPSWGTCTPTTLQGSYDGSSPATIDLSNSKDFTINATDQTTDSSIVFNLQCVTCSTDGGRFAIQDAGVDIFRVNPNGDIILGTAANNLTLAASNGYKPLLSGTARNAKAIRLFAEYPSAVLDTGGTGANLGTMTSGNAAANRRASYYNWTTTQGSAQNYDIIVQIPIPSDFSEWNTATPFWISGYTTDTTNGTVKVEVIKSDGSVDSNFSTFPAISISSNSTWTTGTFALDSSGYTAGDYMTVRVRLTATNGVNVRSGNITLNYLSKF